MIPRLVVSLLLAGLSTSIAGWTLTSSTPLDGAPRGISVFDAQVADGDRQATLTGLVFNEKAHTLRVIDSPAPGETRLAETLAGIGAVAGVNGAYFHEDMRPVGLMVANGEQIHPFEKAKLLAGVLTVRPGKIDIVRSSRFEAGKNLREALQCGPMLLEDAAPVPGLNSERNARRTVVATDERGRWALIYLTSVTLADTANILLLPGLLGDWSPRTALNFDGGGSSGLWVNSTPVALSRPEFSHVRNYLGVFPK